MAGASVGNSKINYDAPEYRLFFESLIYLLQLENKTFKNLTKDQYFDMYANMIALLRTLED